MRSHVAAVQSFNPASLRKILICRINHRLGNALFLTPLIASLNKSLPDCEIDLLLGDAQAAELLSHLPGVGKVYCIAQGTQHPVAIWRLLRELRQRNYDLTIDPVSESFGNRLALRLVGAKTSLGFQTQHQWAPLTYAVTPMVKHPHAALRPLSLLQYLLPQARLIQRLTLAIPPEVTQRLAQSWPRSHQAMTIGFFCEATGAKVLPRAWWQHFVTMLKSMHPQLTFVQVLPPTGGEPLLADVPTASYGELIELAGFMQQLDGFISGDTGPLHLAAAAHTPTIGLFTATNPAKFGPLGPQDLAIRVNQADQHAAQAAAQQVGAHLQKLAEARASDASHAVRAS
jgi:ADP-heptose:LPS heptosyltransferase